MSSYKTTRLPDGITIERHENNGKRTYEAKHPSGAFFIGGTLNEAVSGIKYTLSLKETA